MSLAPTDTLLIRARLLEAGMLCFARYGYQGTDVHLVAETAGCNTTQVISQFGGKVGLYREVLCYIFRKKAAPLVTAVSRLPTGPDASTNELIHGLKNYIRFCAEFMVGDTLSGPVDHAARTLMAREMICPTPEFVKLILAFNRPFNEYLEKCLRSLRPDLSEIDRFTVGRWIQSPLVHLCNTWAPYGLIGEQSEYPRSLPALTRQMVAFIFHGLNLPADDSRRLISRYQLKTKGISQTRPHRGGDRQSPG